MSVVDLRTRHTTSWEDFSSCCQASNSKIFIEGALHLSRSDNLSLDLTIGDTVWLYRDNKNFQIPDHGIELKPGESIVVETEQLIALPFNVLGLVVGRGGYIFRGVFLSPGKIDPGFRGNLSVGILNASKGIIELSKGEKLCSATFFEVESTLINTPFRGKIQPNWENYNISPLKRLNIFFKSNPALANSRIALLVSIPTAIWAIMNMYSWISTHWPVSTTSQI